MADYRLLAMVSKKQCITQLSAHAKSPNCGIDQDFLLTVTEALKQCD